jgi:Uma2 family endonuclease
MNEHLRAKPLVRTTQAAEGLPRRCWTTAELLAMVELGVLDPDEPMELLGGEIVPMSPAGRRHEVITDELAQYWGKRLPPDVCVSVERQFNLDEATYTEPDLIVRPASIKTYDLKGSEALLVVEVADTSFTKDVGVKARIYATFGVREYWVIDAMSLATTVHREPSADGQYVHIAVLPGEVDVIPTLIPALSVRLADLDLA